MPSLAERFAAAHPRLRTAAVTGTNGKTTTVSMIDAIVAASGEPSARLTTLGAWVAGEGVPAPTPEQEFVDTVERAVARGVRTLALETTSKALGLGLAKRWPATVGVFTNLSRDHMDMHPSPEAYLAAKAQLFIALPPGGVAVLNADDPASALIEEVVPDHARVVRYSAGDAGADLAAARVDATAAGTRAALHPGRLADALGGAIEMPVLGAVHAHNAMAAALACDALGYGAGAIARGLGSFGGVPGRFEVVGTRPLVVVDYAHTPDGLVGTLTTARALVGDGGRLVCVFGCGGDRDKGKRPIMGGAADRLADVVVLTSDNPRREDPDAIADAIEAGATGDRAHWHRELDRRAAIEHAIGIAAAADVVVIAGKGHEDVQEIGDRKLPFSDADVARSALG